MSKTKAVSLAVPNGTVPSRGGAKVPTGKINMHFLDKPIIQSGSKLGSNKHNKTSKVGK